MRFLADMGVLPRVVAWLRECGHDVAHLGEIGQDRMRDEEVFGQAVLAGRTVLTFDLDFGEIVARSKDGIVSVVLFRLKNTTTAFVIRRLRFVLHDAAQAIESGAVVAVEDGRHRIRRLPLGA
jgi:predicted nuclease of predicted toxin-antitoxin system